MVGGDIKRIGETLAISDPDGVVDLVKVCVCACVKRTVDTIVKKSGLCYKCFLGEHKVN